MEKQMNIALPGNPRYQPKELVNIFGYDYLYKAYIEIELATLATLVEFKVMPLSDYEKINYATHSALSQVTTTETDRLERAVTQHDIRALVQIIQRIVGPEVGRWVHIPLTSYDVVDTARSLQFWRAFIVLEEKIKKVLQELKILIERFAELPQIGRTHGQHAMPITVGFWLATVAYRICHNYLEMRRYAHMLVGKISGAVGAYNAQVGLEMYENIDGDLFENKVLEKLGLKPALISTQILPPEPLSYFLFSCVSLSAAFGQFGRDCRHLMRSEIGEVAEKFSVGQVGSSTMAHKRNPINFENIEGMWIKNRNEFGKVLDTLISEHQRDLVGSCVARDFPIIVVNLTQQLNTLLRPSDGGRNFLSNIVIDKKRCHANLKENAGLVIAEPLYIALQMAGYQGDAHHFVNKELTPYAKENKVSLFEALLRSEDIEILKVAQRIPNEVQKLLQNPETYTGKAAAKSMEVCRFIETVITSEGGTNTHD